MEAPAMDQELYQPGQRVRVTQQIPRLSGPQIITIEGVLISSKVGKTGSWFAHSKDHKLWLERLELQKDDGERVTLNLDHYSRVEVLD